ncbi:WbuC family cupin fold metalloprotein [Alphaproteobacteria bacterium]|nr:WbuC family cupin fold metalloprotein [Alphaproteobacteria bacterium]
MKVFTPKYLQELSELAAEGQRKRQHKNIHESFADPCQRFFNAIEPDSYIRPHRHSDAGGGELLIGIKGKMALILFDDFGEIAEVIEFGSLHSNENIAIGVEVQPGQWHTVVSFVTGSVLLEVKAGPFDPNAAKEAANWAPSEGSNEAKNYLNELMSNANQILPF